LEYYYDVCAATEELHRFTSVETESWVDSDPVTFASACSLRVTNVHCELAGCAFGFNLELPPLALVKVSGHSGTLQDAFTGLLTRRLIAQSGTITWGQHDLFDCALPAVRTLVTVLDRATLLPVSINAYLALAADKVSGHRIQEVLALLNLQDELSMLAKGMQTQLSHTGSPLMLNQALRLKLAFVLLSETKLLLLTEIFDCVDANVLSAFLQAFTNGQQGSVLYYTKRQDINVFSHQLQLSPEQQRLSAMSASEVTE
jgi:ABC-type transport system involved in cytochrome bd biosynthesis fused ATPase/permease subunit